MTSIDVPRNSAQKQTGKLIPTVNVVFPDQTTPTSFLIYAIPSGLTERLNVLVTNVKFPTSVGSPTIQTRVSGSNIKEFTSDGTIDDTGESFQSLDYVLEGDDEIRITTTNTTTARLQSCQATVSVLQSTKQ